MFARLIPGAAVAMTALIAPPSAEAMTPGCKSRDALAVELASRYGEQMSGAGLRSQSAVVELWSSPDTGSWTMVMSRADGTACIIAHGTDWMTLPPEITGVKS